MDLTTHDIAVVRDHVIVAAGFRETTLKSVLADGHIEIELPDQVDRYGLANVIIQGPLLREVIADLDEEIEFLSGPSRVNENVTINIYGPYRAPTPTDASLATPSV